MHSKQPPTVPLLALVALVGAVALAGLAAAQEPPGSQPAAGWEATADFVGDATCAGCHEETVGAMQGQIHGRIRDFEVQGRTVGCEGCHGPGSEHVDSTDPSMIRTFDAATGAASTCLECHSSKGQHQWPASTHALEGLDCTECHSIHTASAPEASCSNCHADVEASFQLPSHHPVREGKMSCASCHDVHSAEEGAVKAHMQRKDELCFTCHQGVEGPFVFEHEPVEEDCSICHTPHGSVANNLLTVSEPALCLQCHEFHFHAGYDASEHDEVDVGGIERENPWGPEGFRMAFTTSCTQCHTKIHGSDLPSQSVPGRGEALLR